MRICPNSLQLKARELSGVELEDPEVREPLQVLVDSLNHESRLSPNGKEAMEECLVHLLANRLRMERDFLQYPEIAHEKIIEPVFICGLPRSGTTKLQKLLSVTGDFSALPFWMAFSPSLISGKKSEPIGPRIFYAERYVEWVDRTSPKVKITHQFSAHEPEEVNPILQQAFHAFYWSAFVNVPGYIKWETEQDRGHQTNYLKRTLQYLQWQFDIGRDKPWVLKNPTFVGMEIDLMSTFPDAHIVMTHRHPAVAVASLISLKMAFHDLFSKANFHERTTGFMTLEGLSLAMKKHAINRQGSPGTRIVDVSYGDLKESSIAVVEAIYRKLGKPVTELVRARIDSWENHHLQHEHGVHHYSLGDYGLTDNMVDERFSDYIRDFHLFF